MPENEYNEGNMDIVCPFCGEGEFDKERLKYHLEWYCAAYSDTESMTSLFDGER